MAISGLHYAYEQHVQYGNPPPAYAAAFWDEYVARVEAVPANVRHLHVHRGHCVWVEPDEERFLTKELLESTCMIGSHRVEQGRLHALADAGLTVADLDAVVVGCGPGPFTGLRVGMATAAAYGHALGIPVHGVCSLDAIGIDTAGDALVVTDARRREVYWARYRDGVRVEGPAVNAPADVRGAEQELTRPPVYPTVSGLVRAVADWAAEPAPLVPLYLRRPDAKPSVVTK